MAHQRLFPFQHIADSQTTILTSDFMSSIYLFLSLQSGSFPIEFSTKIVHAFIFPPLLSIFPSRNTFLISLKKKYDVFVDRNWFDTRWQ